LAEVALKKKQIDIAPPSLINNVNNIKRARRDVEFDYVPAPSELVGPVLVANNFNSEEGSDDDRTDFDNY
jgi:hypothetical protein